MDKYVIIGRGNIGDKARQLIEKTPVLEEVGFCTPSSTVLAEDFFDGFFQKLNLGRTLTQVEPTPGIEEIIARGSFSEGENLVLLNFLRDQKGPIAVRSSAAGDARGTGIYKSIYSGTDINSAMSAVREVLASYFSPSAVAFRKDANTGEGFAVMLQPLIGQEFDRGFASPLSGIAYSSTSRGAGYISLVPGLGGGVLLGGCERISFTSIEPAIALQDYLIDKSKWIGMGVKRRKYSRLQLNHEFESDYNGLVFKNNATKEAIIDLDGTDTFELNLYSFAKKMEQLESRLGKPQYIEFAITQSKNEPVIWITQIANVTTKSDLFDFSSQGRYLFEAHTVTGSGIRECPTMVKCWYPEECDALRKFNANNPGYILVYSSRLARNKGLFMKEYSIYNNAAVFGEIQNEAHINTNPLSHLDGRLSVTGKYFGVVDDDSDPPLNLEVLVKNMNDDSGLKMWHGRFKVIASEKQNRMMAFSLD